MIPGLHSLSSRSFQNLPSPPPQRWAGAPVACAGLLNDPQPLACATLLLLSWLSHLRAPGTPGFGHGLSSGSVVTFSGPDLDPPWEAHRGGATVSSFSACSVGESGPGGRRCSGTHCPGPPPPATAVWERGLYTPGPPPRHTPGGPGSHTTACSSGGHSGRAKGKATLAPCALPARGPPGPSCARCPAPSSRVFGRWGPSRVPTAAEP